MPEYDARLLTNVQAIADTFEESSGKKPGDYAFAKSVSNWILGDLSRLLNLEGLDITESKITPTHLAELVELIDAGTLSVTMAKIVLEEAFASGDAPGKIVQEKGYIQISDSSVVEAAVAEAIDNNPKAVEEYFRG